jgi:hypothetical protein
MKDTKTINEMGWIVVRRGIAGSLIGSAGGRKRRNADYPQSLCENGE